MLNRRDFLHVAGLTSMATWCTGQTTGSPAETAPQRPNLLWLSCEDISPHLGCYGCGDAITPTLDKLASQGVRFDNAFATAPVCAPNRSCIITGVYAASLGSHHMRSGGEGNSGNLKPKLPGEIVPFPALLRQAGYYCTNNAKEDYNFITDQPIWDESSDKAHWRNRQNPDQPFFAVFNFTGTHESQVRGTPETVAHITHALTDNQRRDPGRLTLPPYHADTPATRRNWANYHELITALDYWVAEMLAQLKTDDLAEDTIVVFWSDHGHGMPRGKRWLQDSGTRIPLILYVPEKWQSLAQTAVGQSDDRLVSCVDLAPSMLNLAGVSIPGFMQGSAFLGPNQAALREIVFATRDRMDERYDMMRMVRDKRYKYIRNYRPDLPYNQFLDYAEQSPIQQDLNRLAAEDLLPPGAAWMKAKVKPVEELYDTAQDPYELKNLADNPQMAEVLQRLRTVHEAAMKEIHDLGLMPEPELVRLEATHGARYRIYEALEKEQPGFWKEIRRVAEAADRESHDDMDLLRAALRHADASMRWWAVIGLRRNPEMDTLLREALKDASPMVAVAAAHGLMLRQAPDADALGTLTAALKGNDEWVRLMALHALDDAGEKARGAIPVLKEALQDRNNKYVARVANHALAALTVIENAVPSAS